MRETGEPQIDDYFQVVGQRHKVAPGDKQTGQNYFQRQEHEGLALPSWICSGHRCDVPPLNLRRERAGHAPHARLLVDRSRPK